MREFVIEPGKIPDNMIVYGVDSHFRRMKAEAAEKVNPEVLRMSDFPSGGRIRFKTASPGIYVRFELARARTECGFDVLSEGYRTGTVVSTADSDTVEGNFYNQMCGEGRRECNVTVFFPGFSPVRRAVIGIEDGRELSSPDPYKIEKPIVFYGSSITMGLAVPTSGRTYTALVAEALGADHLNLGFCGAAKGEPEMAEYVASLDMSAFVMDYDHNADSPAHLRETHKRFFDTVRRAHPDLPILLMSKPDTDRDFRDSVERRRVILDTFHAALDAGDRHVDFADGFYFFGNTSRDKCTVDGCHPTELGAQRMADAVYPRLKALMERK